ncbi:hypothetical protein HZY88_08475 [Aerococcaceae bacterium DSM 111176]|nr:hypothetical protein [Aerococcaceae bacterium DSM 111176]
MHKIKIASAQTVKGNNQYTNELITWNDFVERFRNPIKTYETLKEYHEELAKAEQTTVKDKAGVFVGGWLEVEQEESNLHRTNENILYRTLLTLDYDNATPALIEKLIDDLYDEEHSFIMYSTHSHTKAKPAIRVLIPLSREVNAREHEAIARLVVKAHDEDFTAVDTASFVAGQAMFYATISNDAESDYIFEYQTGELLDADTILEAYGNRAYTDVFKQLGMFTPREREKGAQGLNKGTGALTDPKGRAGYVGAFNRTYNIHEAIEKFIPDVYIETREKDRYTYTEGSSDGGAHVYNDYGEGTFLYSYHDTDPASQQMLNAYDLVRLHKYGKHDADADKADFKNLPSQKMMLELAKKDERVMQEYKKNKPDKPEYSMREQFTAPAGTQANAEQTLEQKIAQEVAELDTSKHDINSIMQLHNGDLYIAELNKPQHKEKLQQLYANTSPKHHLTSFIDKVTDTDTPEIPTGFERLDKQLDGGLYEGLYFLGAISSLGKTTLMLQIADAIAKQGQDVLIFSLEMSRHEIMAKTLSRLSYEIDVASGSSGNNAKTVRDFTNYKRWQYFSSDEMDLLKDSFREYEKFAGNLYIHQGLGDINHAHIRETVRRHTEANPDKRPPVVMVDYLQILAPDDFRASERQNLDKNVLELKRIARDYKIPVFGISSFNRENYSKGASMLSFKESGAIEYSSDVLMGLQFSIQEKYDKENKGVSENSKDYKKVDADEEKSKLPRKLQLVILKNRNGTTGGRINFDYDPRYNHFQESDTNLQPTEQYKLGSGMKKVKPLVKR